MGAGGGNPVAAAGVSGYDRGMAENIELGVDDGTRMAAYVARPLPPAGDRGVLVFQEAFGVNAHIRDIAERMAAQGYLAIAPELFHRSGPGFEGDYNDFAGVRPHMQALTDAGLDADIRAAHGWLVKQKMKRIVSVGFCMGGRVSVRAAAVEPLAAAASFYGSGLPTLSGLAPQIAGRLLLCWGGKDAHIPPEQRREFRDVLKAGHKPYVECVFSEAGHGFFCDRRASYHAPSAQVAWPMLLAFLKGE